MKVRIYLEMKAPLSAEEARTEPQPVVSLRMEPAVDKPAETQQAAVEKLEEAAAAASGSAAATVA